MIARPPTIEVFSDGLRLKVWRDGGQVDWLRQQQAAEISFDLTVYEVEALLRDLPAALAKLKAQTEGKGT